TRLARGLRLRHERVLQAADLDAREVSARGRCRSETVPRRNIAGSIARDRGCQGLESARILMTRTCLAALLALATVAPASAQVEARPVAPAPGAPGVVSQ
ncbi:hypothetical protein, partial [Citrobacter sp. VF227]